MDERSKTKQWEWETDTSVVKTERSHDCQVKVVCVTDVSPVVHWQVIVFSSLFLQPIHTHTRSQHTLLITPRLSDCKNHRQILPSLFTHKPLLQSQILDTNRKTHHKWDLNNTSIKQKEWRLLSVSQMILLSSRVSEEISVTTMLRLDKIMTYAIKRLNVNWNMYHQMIWAAPHSFYSSRFYWMNSYSCPFLLIFINWKT